MPTAAAAKTTSKIASAGSKAPSSSRAVSSPDKVVDAITKGILARRFGVGHRLVEADLANSLNVSRGTVREALKKLAAQGVVRLSPHRGASIRPLSRLEAQHLVVVLEVLCGLAARLAAQNIGQNKARERFKAVADLLTNSHSESGSEQFLAHRANYYGVILALADNAELNRLMPVSQIHLFRSQFQSYLRPKDIRDMQKEYIAVSEAILEGNAAVAEARMRKHMLKTLDRMVAMTEEAFNQDY